MRFLTEPSSLQTSTIPFPDSMLSAPRVPIRLPSTWTVISWAHAAAHERHKIKNRDFIGGRISHWRFDLKYDRRMDLKNAVVLITGGSSGIGRAAAEVLAQAGARVAITGRDPERLAAAARSLGVVGIQADVADEADVLRTFQ